MEPPGESGISGERTADEPGTVTDGAGPKAQKAPLTRTPGRDGAKRSRTGGVPLVVRRLLDGGLLDPDAMTVTGQTIGEAAGDATETPGQAKLGTGTRRKHRKAIA
jgi:hypothetical protein